MDASVLIAYLDGDDTHHAPAEEMLVREIDDDFVANPVTLAEVLVAPLREGRLEEARVALDGLEIEESSFPPETAVRLAQLRVTTGLKMPDCCVLLTARDREARIASFDDALLRAADAQGIPRIEPSR